MLSFTFLPRTSNLHTHTQAPTQAPTQAKAHNTQSSIQRKADLAAWKSVQIRAQQDQVASLQKDIQILQSTLSKLHEIQNDDLVPEDAYPKSMEWLDVPDIFFSAQESLKIWAIGMRNSENFRNANQIYNQLETKKRYAPFLAQFDLTPQEQDTLLDLFLSHDKATDNSLLYALQENISSDNVYQENVTTEQGIEIAEQTEYNAVQAINEILQPHEASFQEAKRHAANNGMRENIHRLDQIMLFQNDPLSQQQFEALAYTYDQIFQEAGVVTDYTDATLYPVNNHTLESIHQDIATAEQAHKELIQQMQTQLTPGQLQTLQEILDEHNQALNDEWGI